MKIIQAIVVFFAILGCLALALGGYFIYNMSTSGDGENLLTQIQALRAENPAEVETTAPVTVQARPDSEYASIIRQYQPTPTPTPTPTPAAAAPATAAQPGAPVQQQVAAAPVQAIATQPPITTPKPDEGKIRNWPSGRKWVALTFDDGPHREWTPKMIELLKSKNVKATFYLLGQEVKRFPDIARSVAENGFEIGNHTVNHPNFNQSRYTPDLIRKELQEGNDLIAQYAGVTTVRTMRPPYGNTPKKLETVCQEMGLAIIAWDVDTNDWSSKVTAKDMVDEVMKNAKDGSIILMHDRHQKTYDTTAEVIDKLREQGYEFVTMSELLGLVPYTPNTAQAVAPAAAQAAPVATQQGTVVPAAGQGGLPAPAAAQGGTVAPPVAAASPAAADMGLPMPGIVGTPPIEVDESRLTLPPTN